MENKNMKEEKILTIAETIYINGIEYCRLLAQGVYTPEREVKFKQRARTAIFKNIDNGNYTDTQEVYLHPKKANNPTLIKYKLSLN